MYTLLANDGSLCIESCTKEFSWFVIFCAKNNRGRKLSMISFWFLDRFTLCALQILLWIYIELLKGGHWKVPLPYILLPIGYIESQKFPHLLKITLFKISKFEGLAWLVLIHHEKFNVALPPDKTNDKSILLFPAINHYWWSFKVEFIVPCLRWFS